MNDKWEVDCSPNALENCIQQYWSYYKDGLMCRFRSILLKRYNPQTKKAVLNRKDIADAIRGNCWVNYVIEESKKWGWTIESQDDDTYIFIAKGDGIQHNVQ